MNQAIQITVTRDKISRGPRITPSRPGSSFSKYLAVAASAPEQQDGDNQSLQLPDVSGPQRRQRWNRVSSASSGRGTPDSSGTAGRVPRLENTYKLKPDPKISFRPSQVRMTVEDVLKMNMHNFRYDPMTSVKLATDLSDAIIAKVKKLGFKRHKFVVLVSVGNIQGQGLNMASRCLWDENTDGHTTVEYKNKELYVVVTVYAVYFE
ncbi:Tctex1 domain-containing protein 2 [Holothuria leucospilota]|uniref:Tctex1 domain-containing protein 2 n=1 Tax=Holothuria leucospilota TaxID=206669 RepID=A0A9Q1C7J1_HOLLE|nr:Tctex1 domain-containing protein 2 [Holothuria leucospilota]